jgi:uncharacterized membrane protein
MDTMTAFYASLAGFVFIHVGLSATGFRRVVTRAVGEPLYQGLFSLASIGLLVALVITYGPAHADPGNAQIWAPPVWTRHAAHVFVFLGFLLAVSGYLAVNPTAFGMQSAARNAEPARGVSRITRHPFLWGVVLWAVGHLISNGDLVGMSMFASIAVMCVLGMSSIDRKMARRDPYGWEGLAAVTSITPFGAILRGRNRLVIGELWWRFVVAIGVYVGVAWVHGAVFGRPVFDFARFGL